MKLIQLNVWWGAKLSQQVASFITDEQPDFLCLQEAASSSDGHTGLFLTTEEMQSIGDLPFASFAPLLSFKFMHRKIGMGNAILSKLPIVQTEFFYTNLSHNSDFDFSKHDYNVRNFLHSVVTTPQGPLNIVTHHGHHVPSHKNGNGETLKQMKQITKYIDGLQGPVILTGDFNLAPHSESLEIVNAKLDNLSITHSLKTTRTDLTHKQEVCDYIFVNDHIKVKNFSASEKVVSDHKALVLEFGLSPGV